MKNTNKRLMELTKRLADPRYRDSFTSTSLLLEEKILDSFGLIQLVVEIDKEFSIAIQNEDLTSQNFATITAMATLVDRYVAMS